MTIGKFSAFTESELEAAKDVVEKSDACNFLRLKEAVEREEAIKKRVIK